jgi:hypothetical protein
MFERRGVKRTQYKKTDIRGWLTWFAKNMKTHNAIPFLLENIQPTWLNRHKEWSYWWFALLFVALTGGFLGGIMIGPLYLLISVQGLERLIILMIGLMTSVFSGSFLLGLMFFFFYGYRNIQWASGITLRWSTVIGGVLGGCISGLIGLPIVSFIFEKIFAEKATMFLSAYVIFFIIFILIFIVLISDTRSSREIKHLGQNVKATTKNCLVISSVMLIVIAMTIGLGAKSLDSTKNVFSFAQELAAVFLLIMGVTWEFIIGSLTVVKFGFFSLIQHFLLRLMIAQNNMIPFSTTPFLDHCVDLIFLRRVGGGYIFVHRLLMEHFAEMYVETPTSKRN